MVRPVQFGRGTLKRFINILFLVGVLLFIPVVPMLKGNTPNKNIIYVGNTAEISEIADKAIPDVDRIIQNAFNTGRSNLQVRGKAVVYRILSDDLKGPRHQRFLLRLKTGYRYW